MLCPRIDKHSFPAARCGRDTAMCVLARPRHGLSSSLAAISRHAPTPLLPPAVERRGERRATSREHLLAGGIRFHAWRNRAPQLFPVDLLPWGHVQWPAGSWSGAAGIDPHAVCPMPDETPNSVPHDSGRCTRTFWTCMGSVPLSAGRCRAGLHRSCLRGTTRAGQCRSALEPGAPLIPVGTAPGAVFDREPVVARTSLGQMVPCHPQA